MSPPPSSFPYHRASSALTFPRDEGWHEVVPAVWALSRRGARRAANPSMARMEWVYLNTHLDEVGGEGRSFVVFAAYFTQHLRFLVVRAWDASDRYLGAWTGSAWGLLTASTERLDLLFRHVGGTDRWDTARKPDGSLDPFHSRLVARDDAARFTVDLDLASTKTPYEAGGIGHLPFGEHGWFDYYSLTRLRAAGHLHLTTPGGAVEAVRVEGIGWYDHQWGPFFVTPLRVPGLEEYEWMSLQLDSGDELLLTTVWDPHGETPDRPAYGGAGLVRAGGTFEHLVGAHRWQRTAFWRSPMQGAVYSAGWRFDAPEWGTSLVITPRHADQLTPVFDPPLPGLVGKAIDAVVDWAPNYVGEFWEGSCRVTGTFAGAPAHGVAFAELVKRYRDPEMRLTLARSDPGLAVVELHATPQDPQVPLTFRATVEQGGAVLQRIAGLDVPVVVLDDPALPRGTPLLVRATAESVDGTLRAMATLSVTLT